MARKKFAIRKNSGNFENLSAATMVGAKRIEQQRLTGAQMNCNFIIF